MFSIVGVAESANQVSNLMRNLEASQWFKSPVLSKVAAEASKDASVSGKPGATQSRELLHRRPIHSL